MRNALQYRRRFLVIALLLQFPVCSGPIPRAQTSSDKPLILEVTWKANTSGRGVAAGISATYEAQEHYQVVSCSGGPLPSLEAIKDRSTIPCLFIRRLDGHIVHAEGHSTGAGETPAYAYNVPANSSAGVPAPGEIVPTSDGMIEIILRPDTGNPVLNATNAAGEESLGCDGTWSHPRITYEQLRHLTTLDHPFDNPAVTDPTMLESCNPGTVSIHIRATGPKEEVEAVIIPPDNYTGWIPQAGDNEETPGNTITIRAELQLKGQPGKKPQQKTGQFKWELTEVSHEPGVCGNWPKTPKKENGTFPPDLKIDPSQAADGQSAQSDTGLKASQVTVTSYDWAPYGKVKLTFIPDDKSKPIEAYVKSTPNVRSGRGVTTLTIPQDDDGNRIADALDKKLGGGKTSADDDNSPVGDGTTGDGLSYWEEARGFRVQGKQQPTNPRKKDFFVFNPDKLDLSLFTSQSGITVHQLNEDEFCDSCDSTNSNHNVLNAASKGSSGWLGNVHVVVIRIGSAGEGGGGLSGCAGCSPKDCTEIRINTAQTAGLGAAQLNMVVAHELAHCSNVYHHGDADYYATDIRYVADNRPVTRKDLGIPSDAQLMVAAPHGEESGVQACIMRYNRAAVLYEHDGGALKWRKVLPSGRESSDYIVGDKYPFDQPGTLFCSRKDDAPPANNKKALEATRGNCAAQFCVNDLKGCKKF
jgi:hypothetical protein